MVSNDFYYLAKKIRQEKKEEEQKLQNSIQYKIKSIYSYYFMWCKAFEKDIEDFKNFRLFLKNENLNIDFLIRKKFIEKYFKLFYKFDYSKNKWVLEE